MSSRWPLIFGVIALSVRPACGQPTLTDRDGDPLPAGALARLGSTRYRVPHGHFFGKRPTIAAIAPDAKRFAAHVEMLCDDGRYEVHVFDAFTGKAIQKLLVDKGVRAITFSPDGKYLAAIENSLAYVWNASNGKLLRKLPVESNSLKSLEFSPDGRFLRADEGSWAIDIPPAQKFKSFVWDAKSGKLVSSSTEQVDALWLPDGNSVLCGSGKHELIVRNIASSEVRKRLALQCEAVPYCLSPDGLLVVLYSHDDAAYLLVELATGKERRRFAGAMHYPAQVRFSPAGDRLFAVGWGGAADVWDTRTGKRVSCRDDCAVDFADLAIAADSAVALGVRNQVYYLWDVCSGKSLSVLPEQDRTIRNLFFSRDGRTLGAMDSGGRVLHWNVATGKVTHRQTCKPKLGVATPWGVLGPDKEKVERGDYDPVLAPDLRHYAVKGTVFDLDTSRKQYGSADGMDLSSFSPDGTRLIRVRGLAVATLDLATSTLTSFAIKDDRFLASVVRFAVGGTAPFMAAVHRGNQNDHALTLCSLNTGKQLWSIPLGNHAGIHRLAVSQHWLAVQCDEELRVIDTATGKVKHCLKARSRPYEETAGFDQSLVFSPDGRTLVEAPVGIWEIATGSLRWRFPTERDFPFAVTFAPNGAVLAGNTTETSVLLWSTDYVPPLPRSKALSDRDLENLWQALAAADASTAWKAMGTLRVCPDQAATLLRRLPAATTSDEQRARMARLLAELDNDDFQVREHAGQRLRALGRQTLSLAKQALRTAATLEKRRRLEALCAKLVASPYTPDELRALRAVELLEKLGTAPARAVLADWSHGDAEAVLTAEAAAALGKLARPKR